MAKVQEKFEALKLRKKGYSYNEILRAIPSLTSKGTLSRWCNSIILTPVQISRIEKKMRVGRDRARFQAILTNRRNREERDQKIHQIARQEFKKYTHDPLFVFGLALYWAEGAKTNRRFQFMNSDPRLIVTMVKWIEQYLHIPKNELSIRLYIHKVYANENCEKYWSNMLDIPEKEMLKTIYKPTPHTVKKNPEYKGCVRIDAPRVIPWLKVMEWERCFIR